MPNCLNKEEQYQNQPVWFSNEDYQRMENKSALTTLTSAAKPMEGCTRAQDSFSYHLKTKPNNPFSHSPPNTGPDTLQYFLL